MIQELQNRVRTFSWNTLINYGAIIAFGQASNSIPQRVINVDILYLCAAFIFLHEVTIITISALQRRGYKIPLIPDHPHRKFVGLWIQRYTEREISRDRWSLLNISFPNGLNDDFEIRGYSIEPDGDPRKIASIEASKAISASFFMKEDDYGTISKDLKTIAYSATYKYPYKEKEGGKAYCQMRLSTDNDEISLISGEMFGMAKNKGADITSLTRASPDEEKLFKILLQGGTADQKSWKVYAADSGASD